MTDYGRGPGSEPWHPDDPLYGDQGWEGQAGTGQDFSSGQPPQQYAQQPQHQDYGAQAQYQQQYGEQGYEGQQPYDGQQFDGQGAAQQYGGGWDTSQQTAMPYGGSPADGYGGTPSGYDGQQHADQYATADAYPPPQPPSHRRDPDPEPTAGAGQWDAEAPEEEKHPFFTGEESDDTDGYDDEPGSRRRRGGGGDDGGERRGKGKKKGRNGCACLVVSLVLFGGLGGVSYFGYQFWQGKFGAPADFAGAGSGSTQIEVPPGAGLAEIGNILKKAGVVKSSGAFVSAAQGKSVEAGVYTLPKEMSGANAVEAMLDPKSRNNLIVPPGKRNVWVYAEIDKRLELKEGTTAAAAKTQLKSLNLPSWVTEAKGLQDPLEGFLFPATYPIAKGTKPESVLKKMVAEANKEYGRTDLAAEASRLGLKSPLELITVASLVQAEGKYKHDFDKVSRVVYNRLKESNVETVGRLEFDSTVNYIKSQSRLDIGSVDKLRELKDPYNTYYIKGLPPGPIGNPGQDALASALKPTPGPWYYFVSITEEETLFAETNREHERNRQKYLEQQKKSDQ
ncbi:endolytic transglycosylase MltG [Streptomyces sp. NBC_00690]|uniref:endolytic transglycosylase MltG n=1 Tax=Streptomyces sp. NBC_00690 TaxID=2975808 RepID=UPI002E2B0504|nr:endolytic transglycosylase MltG [Streptomyces sp. NBC_00690]